MAARYWVGGTGNWNTSTTTNWASSSGGAGGASAPTAADDVFFDANSGTGTTTIINGALCRSVDCTGFTGTISHPTSTTLNIGDGTAGAGNIALKFVAGMTYTNGTGNSSVINFVSTSGTLQDVDSGGKSMPLLQFNGAGGNWQLTSSLTTTANGQGVSVLAGSFSTNNQTLNVGVFNVTGSSTRTVTLGSSTIALTTTGGNAWNATTTTNLTFNANTSTINVSGNGNVSFIGGGLTYNVVNFTSTAQTTLTGANTFATMTRTNASSLGLLILGGNQTVSSAFTVTGVNADSGRLFIKSDTTGTQRTITSNGTNSLTNVDFLDIVGAGSASWTGTSLGNCGNNSGITFTGAVTRYWVGNGGNYHATTNWSTSSGGATGASMPLPHDTAVFDANSITTTGQTIDTTDGQRTGTLDFSSLANAASFGHGTFTLNIFGSLIMRSGMTSNSHLNFAGRGSYVMTSSSVNLGTNLFAIDCATGNSLTLTDSLANNALINWQSGDLTVQGDVTAQGVFFNGSGTRTLTMGSGTYTLSGTAPWSGNNFGGVTINSGTATIKLTSSSASSKTFGFSSGGPYTYYNVENNTTGGGALAIQRGNTFTTLKLSPNSVTEFHGTFTNTVGTFNATGTAGNIITIRSNSSGTAATLSVASGIVSCDYLSLKDSTATGGATFYAGANSTNVSGNTGWIFTAPPSTATGSTSLLLGVG